MVARGKLDIRFSELFRGAFYCASSFIGLKEKAPHFSPNQIPCLSVRTGFNLVLEALNLEAGSEILVTDINIPDMFTIIELRDLKARPLALNKGTLAISTQQMEAAITPKTKVLLITHLFGAVMETNELLEVAKRHNLTVVEDCAQAYDGIYAGNPQSDVAMFSFGMIKTNTALTGALLQINNKQLFNEVYVLNQYLPEQLNKRYLKKIISAVFINLLTNRLPYALAYQFCKLFNKDFDAFISGFTRGFPGKEVMQKIRFRPCNANLKLLQHRLQNFDYAGIQKRKALAAEFLQHIDPAVTIGSENKYHTHWVIPIKVQTPGQLIMKLRNEGFDATLKASSLVKLKPCIPLLGTTEELKLEKLIYLPANLSMTQKEVNRLNQLLLNNLGAGKAEI